MMQGKQGREEAERRRALRHEVCGRLSLAPNFRCKVAERRQKEQRESMRERKPEEKPSAESTANNQS